MSRSPGSEVELQAELDQPRRQSGGGKAKKWTAHRHRVVGLVAPSQKLQVRLVEEIEKLRAKLKSLHLRDLEGFHRGEVPVAYFRFLHDVTARVAQRAERRVDKSAGVKNGSRHTGLGTPAPVPASSRACLGARQRDFISWGSHVAHDNRCLRRIGGLFPFNL